MWPKHRIKELTISVGFLALTAPRQLFVTFDLAATALGTAAKYGISSAQFLFDKRTILSSIVLSFGAVPTATICSVV